MALTNVPPVCMDTKKILTKEELGDMYYDLKAKLSKYSTWVIQGSTEKNEALEKKMAAIKNELGDDFLYMIRLKHENRSLDHALKDTQKNNDELEERIERLEMCIVELRSGKKDTRGSTFRHCESAIPSKMTIDCETYPTNIQI